MQNQLTASSENKASAALPKFLSISFAVLNQFLSFVSQQIGIKARLVFFWQLSERLLSWVLEREKSDCEANTFERNSWLTIAPILQPSPLFLCSKGKSITFGVLR